MNFSYDGDFFVSPEGSDNWNGYLPKPLDDGSDGPLATLDMAQKRIRELGKRGLLDGHTTVWVRGGNYRLNQPWSFTELDKYPVTFAAYPGEEPVIDGGSRISNWEKKELNGNPVWMTDVGMLLKEKRPFRSLFVNGERRKRSRWPKNDWLWMESVPGIDGSARLFDGSDAFVAADGDFRNWSNLEETEVVVSHYWIEERLPVVSFDAESRLVQSSRKSIFALKFGFDARYARYYIENVFEALSEPGEWYLNQKSGKLYYLPMPGEVPGEVEIIAPHLLQFVRLTGDLDRERYVENIHFRGLTFAYSDWESPSGWGKWYDPYKAEESWRPRDSFSHFDRNNLQKQFRKADSEYATVPQGAHNVPGVIFLEAARKCSVSDCRIVHTGWYGIEAGLGCSQIRLIGNTLEDLGGGGIKLEGGDCDSPEPHRTQHNVITDNHIHQAGRVFLSGIGVMVIHSANNRIAHNTIHDLYYSGISVGWVWTREHSTSFNNQIEYNHIYNLGQKVLSDMGGIYLLGVAPGTTVRNNLIHDIVKADYGGWGIYPDEASAFLRIENNIVYNTSSQSVHEHWGRQNLWRNNIFAFGGEGTLVFSRDNNQNWAEWPEMGTIFERNIVVSSGQEMFRDNSGMTPSGDLDCDFNLYWDYENETPLICDLRIPGNWQLESRKYYLQDLHAIGLDRNSKVADPQFVDIEKRDFRLNKNSPALALGFRPINMDTVGIRPPGQRRNKLRGTVALKRK